MKITEKERMLEGKLYIAQGEELKSDYLKARKLSRLFNNTTEEEMEYRSVLLKELLGSTGEKIYIGPPFRCDYGCNITIGDGFYANYDCIIIDVCKVGIGENVFLGANSVINPGVTIGNNVVIGSGSVVTKDIPDNVIAVGNPCKVLRKITIEDTAFWEEKRKEYMESL